MRHSIINYILLLCLFGAGIAGAQTQEQEQEQEQRVRMKDLPLAVQKTVQEQSRGAKIRALTREVEEGKTFFEVELRINGRGRDVLIDPSGAVVETEDQITLAEAPAAVKAEIEKQAGKGRIISVESVTKAGAIVFYEAAIRHARKITEIKISPDGKMI